MTDTALESLTVKLIGDGSSFQSMLRSAQAQTVQAAQTIQQMSLRIEGMKNSFEKFTGAAVSFLTVFGVSGSLMGSFKAFESKELAILRMRSALEAAGRDVEGTTKQYNKFAKSIEDVTTLTAGSVMGLLRQAESFGLTGKQAENATRNAIRFSAEQTGSADSASQYMRISQALEQGDIRQAMRFARTIQQLRGIKDETLFLAKANTLLAAGQKIAEFDGASASNRLERLTRSFKSISVEIGGMVSEALMPFLKMGQQLVEMYKELDPAIKKTVATVVAFALAFMALPGIISYIGFMWQALGLSFAFHTGMMLIGLGLTAIEWLAWQTIVLGASLAVGMFELGLGTLTFLFGLFGGNVALSLLSLVSWQTVMTVANFIIGTATALWAFYTGSVYAAAGANAAYAAGAAFAQGLIWLMTAVVTVATALWVAYTGVGVMPAIAGNAAYTAGLAIAKSIMWLYTSAVAACTAVYGLYTMAAGGASAGTVAWAAVLMIGKGAVWLLNTALGVKNLLLAGIPLLIGLVVVALIAFTGGILLAFAAVTAFIGALIVVTGAIVVVVAGLVVIGTAGFVLFAIGKGLWDIVASLKGTKEVAGGMNGVVAIFWEWWALIKEIVHAAQVDLPLAWQMVQAAFWLAVAQMKAVWTPLWAFITEGATIVSNFLGAAFFTVFLRLGMFAQEVFSKSWTFVQKGFSILWTYVKEEAAESLKAIPWLFVQAHIEAYKEIRALLSILWDYMAEGFTGVAKYTAAVIERALLPAPARAIIPAPKLAKPDKKQLDDAFEPIAKAAEAAATKNLTAQNLLAFEKAKKALMEAAADARIEMPDLLADLQPQVDAAQKKLREALAKFEVNPNHPEILVAKAELDRIRGLISAKEADMAKKAESTGTKVGEGFNKGLKDELKKTEGVARFGAEAVNRIQDYMEKLRTVNANAKAGGVGAGGAAGGGNVAPLPNQPPPAPAPANNPMIQEQVMTNKLIARTNMILEAMANKQGIPLAPANL